MQEEFLASRDCGDLLVDQRGHRSRQLVKCPGSFAQSHPARTVCRHHITDLFENRHHLQSDIQYVRLAVV